MQATNAAGALSLRAIAGSHVVVLAWDAKQDQFDTTNLLGFAIERTELKNNAPVERYFLRGIKRFEHKDQGLAPGTPVPTSEHPIQSFQWGDYTAKPGTKYSYRIVPARGTPKLMTLDDAAAVAATVTTEPLADGVHSIFFNRGVAGSQAYARRFTDPSPDPEDPDTAQMKWLSRGLYEALVGFIRRATDGTYALRAALYEFRYNPVGAEFKAARGRQVDVKILYDEPNYGSHNKKLINKYGLSTVCAPRKSGGGQKHNKFIVLLRNGNPEEVWTGSTNISDGGIFGHSNVGHIVRDPAIARAYLDYWNALCNPAVPAPAASKGFAASRQGDPTNSVLVKRNNQAAPTPGGNPQAPSITALFSPRDAKTLQWYADRMAKAKELMCFTVAFSLAKPFEPFLAKDSSVLRFVLSDKELPQQAFITTDHDVVYAAGAKLEQGQLPNFRSEKLTGWNGIPYIHNKFMLIDPLSADPTVITGSANFSGASQGTNDENMLIIRGDRRVADIYFGEFMRMFDHLYARYLAKKIAAAQKKKPKPTTSGSSGYLRDNASWVAEHFADGRKSRRRQYFHGKWGP